MQSGQAFSIRDLGFQRAVKSLDLVRRLSANDPPARREGGVHPWRKEERYDPHLDQGCIRGLWWGESVPHALFLLHQGLLSAQGILLSVLVRHAQQMGAISLHVVGEWKLSAFLLDQLQVVVMVVEG